MKKKIAKLLQSNLIKYSSVFIVLFLIGIFKMQSSAYAAAYPWTNAGYFFMYFTDADGTNYGYRIDVNFGSGFTSHNVASQEQGGSNWGADNITYTVTTILGNDTKKPFLWFNYVGNDQPDQGGHYRNVTIQFLVPRTVGVDTIQFADMSGNLVAHSFNDESSADDISKNLYRTGATFTIQELGIQVWGDKADDNSTDMQNTSHVKIYLKTAYNKYKVMYHANGGDGDDYAQDCTYGTSYNYLNNNFTNGNMTFAGWNTRNDGQGEWRACGNNFFNLTTQSNSTIDLYAIWQPVDQFIYYDGNSNDDNTQYYIDSCQASYPTGYAANFFSKIGYKFTGWNAKKDGSGIYRTGDRKNQINGYTTISSANDTNKVIDNNDNRADNGNKVQIWDSYNNTAQQWYFQYVKTENDTPYWIIKNKGNSKVLDADASSYGNGDHVILWEYSGGDNQLWTVQECGDGYYFIKNKAGNYYLDLSGGNTTNGTNLQIWEPNGSTAQKWKIDNYALQLSGCTEIQNAINTIKTIDSDDGKTENGNKIQIWDSYNNTAQQWVFQYIKTENNTPYWAIRNKRNGKVLDADAGSYGSGDHVILWEYGGGDNQLWTVQACGDGYYFIKNKAGNYYLDLSGGDTTNGTNIQIWEPNGSTAQKWKLPGITINCYAQWVQVNSDVTINHYVMDVNGNYPTTPTEKDEKNYNFGSTVTVSDLKNTRLEVSQGVGYAYGMEGGIKTTTVKISDNIKQIDLYYERQKHNVTYDAVTNGGKMLDGGSTKTISLYYGTQIDLTGYSGAREGWDFIGWNTDSSATTATKSLQMNTSDITVYGLYSRTITESFIDSAGTRNVSTIIYNKATGGKINAPAITAYTDWNDVSAITAVGWSTTAKLAADTAITCDLTSGQTGIEIRSNKTYYAIYSATAALTYNLNEGQGSSSPAQSDIVVYKSAANLTAVAGKSLPLAASQTYDTESDGYTHTFTLGAWAENSIDGKPYAPGDSYLLTRNTTMFAIWNREDTAFTYTIQFDGNNGVSVEGVPGTMTATYNVATPLPSGTPKRVAFTFIGWNTKQDGSGVTYQPGEAVKNLTSVKDGAVTLYGTWKQKKIQIIKTSSTIYNDTLIKRTAGDEAWYDSVGYMTINDLQNYSEDKCVQVWTIDNKGNVIKYGKKG